MKEHRALFLAMSALAIGCAASQSSWGTSISLGDASDYAVLQYNAAGRGQTQFSISGGSTVVAGPLGSAANTKVNFLGNQPAGPLYQSSTNTGGNNYNGLTPVTGSSVDATLAQAVTDAKNASSAAASLTPTQPTISATLTGGQTIAATVTGQNVINLTGGINLTGSTGITISGTASDVFIINVDSKLVSNNGASITLTGGVKASDILWNYLGTSDASFTGGGHAQTWDGTVLAPDAKISAHDRTFNGALIAGGDISITSNPAVVFEPFPAPPSSGPIATVAAPPTIISLRLGLVGVGLGTLCRCRHRTRYRVGFIEG